MTLIHKDEQMSRTLHDIHHAGWCSLYWQRREFLPLIFAGIQWYQTRPSGCRPPWRLRLIWKLKDRLTLCIITMTPSTRRGVNYGIKTVPQRQCCDVIGNIQFILSIEYSYSIACIFNKHSKLLKRMGCSLNWSDMMQVFTLKLQMNSWCSL